VTFRNNTVSGNLPSSAFAMTLRAVGSNPDNENIRFYNNVWSDPTGTMNDFSDTVPGETGSLALSNNLYWNAGRAIPSEAGDLLNAGSDARRVVADPGIRAPDGVAIPRWNAQNRQFGGGFGSICDAFTHIAKTYGAARPDGPVLNAGDSGNAPGDDLLGRQRTGGADLGALESENYLITRIIPGDETVLVTWETGGSLPSGATWRITYDGPSGDTPSPITGLPADQRAFRINRLPNYNPFSVSVAAEANGRMLMSSSTPAFASDIQTFLPGVKK
jgi:hypothetical protein